MKVAGPMSDNKPIDERVKDLETIALWAEPMIRELQNRVAELERNAGTAQTTIEEDQAWIETPDAQKSVDTNPPT